MPSLYATFKCDGCFLLLHLPRSTCQAQRARLPAGTLCPQHSDLPSPATPQLTNVIAIITPTLSPGVVAVSVAKGLTVPCMHESDIDKHIEAAGDAQAGGEVKEGGQSRVFLSPEQVNGTPIVIKVWRVLVKPFIPMKLRAIGPTRHLHAAGAAADDGADQLAALEAIGARETALTVTADTMCLAASLPPCPCFERLLAVCPARAAAMYERAEGMTLAEMLRAAAPLPPLRRGASAEEARAYREDSKRRAAVFTWYDRVLAVVGMAEVLLQLEEIQVAHLDLKPGGWHACVHADMPC